MAALRRSSFSRRRLALGAAVAAVILLALFASGLLSRGDHGPRASTARYLEEVNAVQRELGVEVATANNTYSRVRAKPRSMPAEVPQLRRAERVLRRLQLRVAALEPPLQARTFHRKLVRMLDAQAAFAGDVVGLARFLPALAHEQQLLAAVTTSLRDSLASATTLRGKARAFDSFATATHSVGLEFATAPAPSVLVPLRRAEVAHVQDLSVTAGEVATYLRAGQTADASQSARELAVSAQNGTTDAYRKAVLAFDGKVRRIAEQRLALEQEWVHLGNTLR